MIDPSVTLSHLDVEAIATKLTAVFQDASHGFITFSRQAAFLATLLEESAHFTHVEENLNYSATGLLKTFPKHFSIPDSVAYAHHPEKIANRAYADRMGNGDEASGDGWKFRGRGFIQLTGKDNYTDIGALTNPDRLTTPEGAVDSAVWFYTVKHTNLNTLADIGNIAAITHIVNGGSNGLPERIAFYNKARDVLPL